MVALVLFWWITKKILPLRRWHYAKPSGADVVLTAGRMGL